MSVPESAPKTLSLVASIPVLLVHPLVEVLFSKNSKFVSYSVASQAIILAQEIELESLKAQIEAMKRQCVVRKMHPMSMHPLHQVY